MTEQRVITEQQEQVYRCRHHDFGALTTKETAEALSISESTVCRVLKQLEKEAPQLFPVLNHRQNLVYIWITEFGHTHDYVAHHMDISVKAVDRIVTQLKAKGMSFAKPAKTVRYENHMDSNVVHKF